MPGTSAAKESADRTIVTTCVNGIAAGWDEGELFKLVISGIARHFRNADETTRQRLLATRPPLSNTRWDAVIAAVVEHVATLHGYEPPAWVEEKERFWARPKALRPAGTTTAAMAMNGLACGPAAFLRRGVVTDPRDLDGRGGEIPSWGRKG